MKNRFAMIAAVTLVLSANALGAQPLLGTPTGLASPAQTYDFEGYASGTPASNQYANVTFGPGLFIGNDGYFSTVGGATGSLDNFGNGYISPFNIYFSQAVNGAAFQYVSNTGSTLFEAYLSGNLVGSYSAITSTAQIGGLTPQFYGFDNLMLDRLQVYTEQGVNGAMALDNLETGSVVATPEPGSVILVATGLFAVVGTARLRRKNSLS